MTTPTSLQTRRLLSVEYLPPAALNREPTNPRVHTALQVAAIAKSIRAFSFTSPILADEAGTIIAGHGRFEAALKLGLAEVPAIRLEHLNPNQRRALMIADNRLSEIGGAWDERRLAEALRDLSLADLNFELDDVGFSVGEIDFRIEGLSGDADEADPADAPVALATDAVSATGDLWRLGPHRVLCGSALDPMAWQLLMNGQLAAMGFTDPPYSVKIRGHVSGLGRIQHREFVMGGGEMGRDGLIDFLGTSLGQMARHSVPGSIHFASIDWKHVPEMVAAGEAVFTELKNICVWQKHVGSMGSLYRSQHELFFVWKSGRARHRNNVQLGKNGRNRTNIWSYPGIGGFRHSDEGDLLELHPTVKPVKLVADAILDVSARGDIVIDGFLGSGTTTCAAQRVGRVAYGLELDPLYVDTIVRRYEALTGDQAIHDASGLTFAETSDRRRSPDGEQGK